MTFKRPCASCGKTFQPTGKSTKVCAKCKRINFIKSCFERRGKFKGITNLKEALEQYAQTN